MHPKEVSSGRVVEEDRVDSDFELRVPRFIGALGLAALIALLGACSGESPPRDPTGGDPTGAPSAGGPGSPGSGGGQSSGGSGSGVGGARPNGTSGAASGGVSGGGLEEDPYAIPTTPPAAVLVPTPRLARLSRPQWANAVRDLLKLSDIAEIEHGVSGDALTGFDSEAEALFVTEQLRQQLADAAEKLADKVTADAAALAALVPANAPADAAGRARAFITSFGQRAFRRPLSDAEVTSHLGLFNQGPTLYPSVDAFKAGASLVIQAMLQSPHFLYRTELGTATPGATAVPLNDYEVATKLSLALTNTMPDDELFAAAAGGKLRDRAEVTAQAKRLLEGPRALVGLDHFNLQVYRLGTYDGIVRDPMVFPDFKPNAPASMRQEVLQFLDFMFTSGRGIKDFYTTPVGFVNSALAPLYGLSGTFTGDALTKVDLDPAQRSGLLTQPGFLSSYITGTDPDTIHRGVFIATRLLCIELPPPAPDATPLVPPQANMTNRERVEKTTGKGTCGESCHGALLNPLGFAFENYDAIGKYRTMDRGKPINAADAYTLDGKLRSFSNALELSRLLADAKQTHACYIQNMMTYMHGREMASEERATIDYYARLSRAGMLSLRDLMLTIVTSDPFLNRLP